MPDCVYQMGNLRIVDLTKVLDPKTESRRCHLIRYNTGGPIPDFHTALDLTSHLGTHCECPYHLFEDGKSVGELPLTTFMGRAIYVNIDFLEPNSHISAADLDRACGDRIQEGDIVSITLDEDGNAAFITVQVNLQRLQIIGIHFGEHISHHLGNSYFPIFFPTLRCGCSHHHRGKIHSCALYLQRIF